ncbi:MAG TPA: hypothetical protein VK709_12135 [Candidatus Saccharimonadales bacterium]|jgi:hypothetical protein|nr:hypothetical protein [Candidatus Saccharimonadales bacterium]
MGRTVPTFRQLIDDAIARWSKFRRALRREDQEYFDRLFRSVRTYTQAATYQASDNPMEAILLSIAIDQEKRLDALEHAALEHGALEHAALLPKANASITLNQPEESQAQLDAHKSPNENEQPERQLHTKRDTQLHPQHEGNLHEQRGKQPGKQLNPHQQLSFDQRMDFRSLPEPARDDAVADRPEPDAPPAD